MIRAVVTTRAAGLVVETEEMLRFLQKPDQEETSDIEEMILAASRIVSAEVERTLLTETVEWWCDPEDVQRVASSESEWTGRAVGAIELPAPPLRTVTAVVTVARNGLETTVGSGTYQVDTRGGAANEFADPGRVLFYELPSVGDLRASGGVVVRGTAGYGAAGLEVPEGLRAAVKKVAAQLFIHRVARNTGGGVEAIGPSAATYKLITNPVRGLLAPYKHRFMG